MTPAAEKRIAIGSSITARKLASASIRAQRQTENGAYISAIARNRRRSENMPNIYLRLGTSGQIASKITRRRRQASPKISQSKHPRGVSAQSATVDITRYQMAGQKLEKRARAQAGDIARLVPARNNLVSSQARERGARRRRLKSVKAEQAIA